MRITRGTQVVVFSLALAGTIGLGTAVMAVQKPARPATAKSPPTPKAEDPKKAASVPSDGKTGELSTLVEGQIVRSAEVTQDCLILAYMPDWGFGNVDNLAIEGVNGGVRTLVDWPNLPAKEAETEALQFYLAFYSRTTKFNPKPGSILALEISEGWPERTSWKTRPFTEPDPVGTYTVEPSEGWKVFNITSFVRKNEGRSGHGLMFRFLNEDRPASKETAGYQFVSREGAEQWADKRPRLIVVDRTKK